MLYGMILTMAKKKDSRGGQPSIAERFGEPTVTVSVILPESQRAWLMSHYFGIAAGIRHLIDQDMRRAAARDNDAQSPANDIPT